MKRQPVTTQNSTTVQYVKTGTTRHSDVQKAGHNWARVSRFILEIILTRQASIEGQCQLAEALEQQGIVRSSNPPLQLSETVASKCSLANPLDFGTGCI